MPPSALWGTWPSLGRAPSPPAVWVGPASDAGARRTGLRTASPHAPRAGPVTGRANRTRERNEEGGRGREQSQPPQQCRCRVLSSDTASRPAGVAAGSRESGAGPAGGAAERRLHGTPQTTCPPAMTGEALEAQRQRAATRRGPGLRAQASPGQLPGPGLCWGLGGGGSHATLGLAALRPWRAVQAGQAGGSGSGVSAGTGSP